MRWRTKAPPWFQWMQSRRGNRDHCRSEVMIESTEVISLLLATGVVFFLGVYRAQLRGIPNFGLLSFGFMALYVSLLCTVAEGFVLADALNQAVLERHCRAAKA